MDRTSCIAMPPAKSVAELALHDWQKMQQGERKEAEKLLLRRARYHRSTSPHSPSVKQASRQTTSHSNEAHHMDADGIILGIHRLEAGSTLTLVLYIRW